MKTKSEKIKKEFDWSSIEPKMKMSDAIGCIEVAEVHLKRVRKYLESRMPKKKLNENQK